MEEREASIVDDPGRLYEGELTGGATYLFHVPAQWSGTLLLHCPGFAPAPGSAPPLAPHPSIARHLLEGGHALASVAYSTRGFWPVEHAFVELTAALDLFEEAVSEPARTIPFGNSIGGIITAGLVQVSRERLSGAVPMCGSLAGGVGTRNQNLDCAFAFQTLLAADSELEVVRISDQERNAALASCLLREAQETAAGRARIALASALGGIPGWHGALSTEPESSETEARQRAQYQWLDEIDFDVFFGHRAILERRAGGNPSWNLDVDYGEQLERSSHEPLVSALYESAGIRLDADLERLASAERIIADEEAVEYLEAHVVFNGDLGGLPVLTMHTSADGLVVVESEQAYADVVESADHADLLRQLFIRRAGHCTFAIAETLTAIDVLVERVERGSWPALDPDALNSRAESFGSESAALPSGPSVASAFDAYSPNCFLRPYDERHRVERSAGTRSSSDPRRILQ